jgi:hypothetical protein
MYDEGDPTRLEDMATLRPIERLSYAVAAVLVASGLFHLAVAAVDPRPWDGPLSWRKAVTFGLSFGITLASITWVARPLRLGDRTRAWLLGVFAVDCVVEVAGITVQAWRHVPSHFNTETPFDTVVAMSLAFGGGVLIAVLGTLAVTAFRGRIDGSTSVRLALRAGFALLLAGLAAGAAMITRGETLIKAGHRQQAYDTAGFLKGFHAVTLHGVLVLPALAWVLSRTRLSERNRTRIVAAGLTGYALAAAVVLVVNVRAL